MSSVRVGTEHNEVQQNRTAHVLKSRLRFLRTCHQDTPNKPIYAAMGRHPPTPWTFAPTGPAWPALYYIVNPKVSLCSGPTSPKGFSSMKVASKPRVAASSFKAE